MRFVAYYQDGRRSRRNISMGIVINDKVAPLTDVDTFYDDLPNWTKRASELSEGSLALAGLVLAPPVPAGAKVVCAAINYGKHGTEAKLPNPHFPNLFARWTSELVADGDAVPVPNAEPEGLDWEVELAAIVGANLTDADPETAERGMFGYTVVNEISARYAQVKAMELSTGQWCLGKNPEKGLPIASFVESADGFDHRNRKLETHLNGKVMQSGNTNDMIFGVGELAAFASQLVTLRPGDLICTGTPDGVGYARSPRLMMKAGDVIKVSLEGIGSISNPVVDSSGRG